VQQGLVRDACVLAPQVAGATGSGAPPVARGSGASAALDFALVMDERTGLTSAPAPAAEPRRTRNNFLLMCVAFSFNHGSAVAVLNISIALLGRDGSYMSGVLYVAYALTALLFATAPIDLLGARKALIAACSCFCLYVVAFPICLLIPASRQAASIVVAMLGGLMGGFAAGFAWVAQGQYFTSAAKRYAAEKLIDESEANQDFASTFAFILLSTEVLLKVFPVLLLPVSHNEVVAAASGKRVATSDLIVAVVYSVVAVGACILLRNIDDLDPRPTALLAGDAGRGGGGSDRSGGPQPKRFTLEKATAVLSLWRRQPTVLLLSFIQITFGLCSSLMTEEVTGNLIPQAYPQDKVIVGSLMGTLVALVAATLQLPSKILRARVGRAPLILVGMLAFLWETALIGSLSSNELGQLRHLTSLYVLQGVGRSSFEGTNKALFADFFPADASAAFSSIVFFNGAASALGYFAFPALGHDPDGKAIKAAICCTSATLAVVGYLTAEWAQQRTKTTL